MYPNNSMPRFNRNMPNRTYRNGDRFGGGFIVPFVLGGITGSLINNRPNYYGPVPQPYPVMYPIPYPPYQPYQTYQENYYYY